MAESIEPTNNDNSSTAPGRAPDKSPIDPSLTRSTSSSTRSAGRLAVHLIGFVIGLALLGWCVYTAARQGDWSRLLNAHPTHVALLVGCTMVSLVANGMTFWITIQPVKRLCFRNLMLLNVLANLLNYAPLRLGAIARVAYHLRVDRLKLLTIGAWFACILWIFGLGVGSAASATIMRPQLDLVWILLFIGQLVLGGALTRAVIGWRFISPYSQGADVMLRSPAALWGAMALRIVDIAAYIGRMAAAMLMLELTIPASHVVLLALVATVANLIPFGRLGFREMAVTIVALRLNALGLDGSAIEQFDEGRWAQLALIESAGEAIVVVPCGLCVAWWYRKRWREAA